MNFSGNIYRGSRALVNNHHPIQDGSGNQYTLPSGTGTVKVCMKPNDNQYFYNITSGKTCTLGFYLSDGNNTKIKIASIVVNYGSPVKSGEIPSGSAQSVNLSSLAGKALYAWFQIETGSNGSMYGARMPITLKSNTAVVAGNTIVTADINQTGASISSGTIMTNSKFSAGTKAEASTFNSQVLDV